MKKNCFTSLVTVLISSFAWAQSLSVNAPHKSVPFNSKFNIQVSGGSPPYKFSVSYGPAIVSSSGEVTAGKKNGQVKVFVYDSRNKRKDIRFRVLKAADPVPTPPPNPPPVPTPNPSPTAEILFKVPSQKPAVCQWIVREDCASFKYSRKVSVKDASELRSALANLRSGDLVQLQNGIYNGTFTVSLKSIGPTYICADQGAVIDGGSVKSGYGLHLNSASNIVVSGIEVRNVQKGIMMDSALNIVLHNVKVSGVGDEGVHFRNNTKNSILINSLISNAGLFQPDFGEGVYLGSSKNKWCPNGSSCGEPDRSDCNFISGNRIANVKAESIDVKEGTQNNMIYQNVFEGSGMTGAYADSFIDVKGNKTLVLNNSGVVGQCGSKACQLNGFQTHVAVPGWGDQNIFSGNRISGGIGGPVVGLQKVLLNVVHCNNTSDNGAAALNGVCSNP